MRDAADPDPVNRMAVAHYQCEAIHPFTVGNGRTGRVLKLLMLVEQGLLDQPALCLSRYIVRNETAQRTLAKIAAARTLIEGTAEYARKAVPKQYSRELIDLVFVQPHCRIENVVEAGIAKRQTASAYLYSLAEVGIVRDEQVGLNKQFLNVKFLRLLTREPNSHRRFGSR